MARMVSPPSSLSASHPPLYRPLSEAAVEEFAEARASIAAPTLLWKRLDNGEDIDLEGIACWLQDLITNRSHEMADLVDGSAS